MSSATQMSEATMTIRALSEEFPQHIIQIKPGSKPGAAQYKPATPYVSHGSVTKRLNDVCPGWSSRVVEWHTYIDPAGKLQCAGVTLEVTVPNAGSHQEFGKAATPRNFGDDAKNAMSDALKRCAMRFGVALDLWESADEHDEDSPYEANPKDGGYEGGLRQPQRPVPASNGTPVPADRAVQPNIVFTHNPPAGSPLPHPLLAEIRNQDAPVKDREQALTDYYMGAHTIEELNKRQEAVRGSGISSRVVTATYNWHADRIDGTAAAPAAAPAGRAG